MKDDGQEYDKTGKEVLTLRRIDSLIALDSDENLQKEFKEQSQYLEGLYNGVDTIEDNEASNSPTTEETQERPSRDKEGENVETSAKSDSGSKLAHSERMEPVQERSQELKKMKRKLRLKGQKTHKVLKRKKLWRQKKRRKL